MTVDNVDVAVGDVNVTVDDVDVTVVPRGSGSSSSLVGEDKYRKPKVC